MRTLSALLLVGLGLLAPAMNGCAPESEEETDDAADRLTLTDGSKFVVSASPEQVVLKTSTGDCSNCGLLETLVRDSKNKIDSLDDLKGKSILVHPIDGKAEDGAFLRVKKITKKKGKIVLDGDPVLLEEIDSLDEDDVVRIYMDKKIPKAGGTISGKSNTAGFAPQLAPSTFNFDTSLRPAGFGGLLAGDAPTVVVWKGVNPQVDFLGFIRPYVSDMSFRPEVRLDWQRGRGLEVGARLDFESEAGLAIDGILGGTTQLFKQSVETPDITMLVPAALALPFKMTISVSFGCNAVAGGKIALDYSQKFKLHAGGSAVIHPEWGKPVTEWVSPGAWPFELDASADGGFKKFEAGPSAGILCTVRVGLNFAPKWFPAGGLFIAISPRMTLVNSANQTSLIPDPRWSVDLLAGAWTKNNLAVEASLLRWTP